MRGLILVRPVIHEGRIIFLESGSISLVEMARLAAPLRFSLDKSMHLDSPSSLYDRETQDTLWGGG